MFGICLCLTRETIDAVDCIPRVFTTLSHCWDLNLKHPHCPTWTVGTCLHGHSVIDPLLVGMYLRRPLCLLSSQQWYRPAHQCTAKEESSRSPESGLPLRRDRDLDVLVDELRLLSFQACRAVWTVAALKSGNLAFRRTWRLHDLIECTVSWGS